MYGQGIGLSRIGLSHGGECYEGDVWVCGREGGGERGPLLVCGPILAATIPQVPVAPPGRGFGIRRPQRIDMSVINPYVPILSLNKMRMWGKQCCL